MALKNSILLWLILLVLLAAVPTVRAELTYLPESSYYSGQTHYGVSLGPGEILSGRIEFAVYDTLVYPDEFTGPVPGEGRYVYAYQIFNDNESYSAALSYFQIEGIAEGAIPTENPNENIGTDDSSSGVDATVAYFTPSLTEGVWEFDGGLVAAGDNSVFLLISSDGAMKAGDYQVVTPQDGDVPVPDEDDNGDPSVPEPATLLLLAAGSVLSFRKTRSV